MQLFIYETYSYRRITTFSFDFHSWCCNSTNISKIFKLKNSRMESVSLNLSTGGKVGSSKFLLLRDLYTFSSHFSQSYSSDTLTKYMKLCSNIFKKRSSNLKKIYSLTCSHISALSVISILQFRGRLFDLFI